MIARRCLCVGLVLALAPTLRVSAQETIPAPGVPQVTPLPAPVQEPAPPVEDAPAPQPAQSTLTDVTVYQGTALVRRDVVVPRGKGLIEIVVTPLPSWVIPSSLYAEAGDGLRVLSTRFRARAVREDTRTAVRDKEEAVKTLRAEARGLLAETEVARQDKEFFQKLEGFTAATAQHLIDQGRFDSEAIIELSKYLMVTRAARAEAAALLEGRTLANTEAIEFASRQLAELSTGSSRTAHDAVILVEKEQDAPGVVTLNYLVNNATWRPQYRLRAGAEAEPVELEYLAAVTQQSGEDWGDVRITLSTAQPALNAAPPDLMPLEISASPGGDDAGNGIVSNPGAVGRGAGGMGAMGGGMGGMGSTAPAGAPAGGYGMALEQYAAQARAFRGQAQTELNRNDARTGNELMNRAAALDQTRELLARDDEDKAKGEPGADGPTVTFRLPGKMAIPSRRDALLVEVTKFPMKAEFFDKAVPVLTPRVYRLANLVNSSSNVLLSGEATMYVGADFVGRMTLPLVASGEPFTVGFGVDPQVQVYRKLVKKSRTLQGGNQVHTYEFRIQARSFHTAPVNLRVWDRLPKAADEDVVVNLVEAQPEVSTDAVYLRNIRPDNLLRWDLVVQPNKDGAKPETITYSYRLEFARELAIDALTARGMAGASIGGGANGAFGGMAPMPAQP